MITQTTFPSMTELALGHEQTWLALYELLRPSVTLFVYLYAVPSWHGQENDLIEDVLQETVIRIYLQMPTAANGKIQNMEAFCRTIARNYCRDLRRKERRLQPLPDDDYSFESVTKRDTDDPIETAFEALFTQTVLVAVAQLIATFPAKQRMAILIDLAHQPGNGDTQLPSLEKALATVHIDLKVYRGLLPTGPVEKTRHSSLLSIAYKRLRGEFIQRHAHLGA